MTFYDKVNDLCKEHGISITSLALALGFSKGTPTNWKTMTKPPRAENVKKVADYFGVPTSYFNEATNQTIHDNHGIIGDTHAPITIHNDTSDLGEIEQEIVNICKKLDIKRKNALLTRAYELLDENN